MSIDVNAYEKYIPKIQYLSEIWYKLPFYYIQWEKTNYSNIFWNISELYYLVNSWYIYNFLEKKNKIIQNNFTNYFEWFYLYNTQPLEDISKSNNSEKLDEILHIKKLFDEINQKISFIWIIKILETNTFSDVKNIFLYLKNLEFQKQNKIIRTLHIKKLENFSTLELLELLYFINALESKKIKDSVTKLLKNDYNNTDSEIWWKIQINANNQIVIQPFSSESKNDWTYLPTKDFYNNDLDYNYHFRIHGVKNMRNNMYAGPSTMDLLNNSFNQKTSIVNLII